MRFSSSEPIKQGALSSLVLTRTAILCTLFVGLVAGEGDAAARVVAAPIVASEATPALDTRPQRQCAGKVQALVGSLFTAIETDAVGYEPEIVSAIADLLVADFQITVTRKSDGTNTRTSQGVAAGRGGGRPTSMSSARFSNETFVWRSAHG